MWGLQRSSRNPDPIPPKTTPTFLGKKWFQYSNEINAKTAKSAKKAPPPKPNDHQNSNLNGLDEGTFIGHWAFVLS